MPKNFQSKLRTVLASLELGLAEEELDFLGNILFEDSPDFIDSGDDLFNTLLIFRTQEDAKVDDEICLPLQNQEFEFDDPLRPTIPDDTHPNCRCYWESVDSGANLGQDGAFASASMKRVTQEFADNFFFSCWFLLLFWVQLCLFVSFSLCIFCLFLNSWNYFF